MIAKTETPHFVVDLIKWSLVFFLLTAGVAGFYYFASFPLYLRILGEMVLLGISIAVAANTAHGIRVFAFWTEAKAEILRVVWPTREETTKLTVLVVVVVVILSFLLWLLDAILAKTIASLIGW